MINVFDGSTFLVKRDKPLVVRDTETIVDPVFVSRDKQIASFIRSGEKLRSFRSSFEYPDGDVPEDVRPDPTMDIGFDYADASALQLHLQRKVSQIKAAQVKPEGSQGNAAEGVPAEETPEVNS